jgi:hypothetical protein
VSRVARGTVLGLAAALAVVVAACSVRRIDSGVYHSPKGYRVVVPGPDWEVVERSRADLELRHRGGAAGLLAHATCDEAARRRSPDALGRSLLAGLRDRTVLERGQVSLNGRPASRTVVEARSEVGGPEIRIEIITVTGSRCVYDLMYAAPAAGFDARRADFQRLTGSFTAE